MGQIQILWNFFPDMEKFGLHKCIIFSAEIREVFYVMPVAGVVYKYDALEMSKAKSGKWCKIRLGYKLYN